MVGLYFTDKLGNRDCLGIFTTCEAASRAAYDVAGLPYDQPFIVLTIEQGQFTTTEISREDAEDLLDDMSFLY